MELISLKDQNINGIRRLKEGEKFEVSESTARFLIRLNRARPSDVEAKSKKGRYERRDMRAEN